MSKFPKRAMRDACDVKLHYFNTSLKEIQREIIAKEKELLVLKQQEQDMKDARTCFIDEFQRILNILNL